MDFRNKSGDKDGQNISYLTPVGDTVPQSAQAGGGELVQGVPANLVSEMSRS